MTDPLETAKQTLAQLHAQTVQQEGILRKMHTEGADHFAPGLGKAATELKGCRLHPYC